MTVKCQIAKQLGSKRSYIYWWLSPLVTSAATPNISVGAVGVVNRRSRSSSPLLALVFYGFRLPQRSHRVSRRAEESLPPPAKISCFAAYTRSAARAKKEAKDRVFAQSKPRDVAQDSGCIERTLCIGFSCVLGRVLHELGGRPLFYAGCNASSLQRGLFFLMLMMKVGSE
jgi:hypothetical protein